MGDRSRQISSSLFAYQVFMIVEPRPALEYLLETAETVSAERAQDDGAD